MGVLSCSRQIQVGMEADFSKNPFCSGQVSRPDENVQVGELPLRHIVIEDVRQDRAFIGQCRHSA